MYRVMGILTLKYCLDFQITLFWVIALWVKIKGISSLIFLRSLPLTGFSVLTQLNLYKNQNQQTCAHKKLNFKIKLKYQQ